MSSPDLNVRHPKRRSFRRFLSHLSRRLPSWARGRLRFGTGIDKFLGWTGYCNWQESVRCSHGVRMFLDTDEPQQRQIYWTGIYDRIAVETLAHHLPDGGVLVDVGAGVGSICLFVLRACTKIGKSITAHAFEPMGLNYDRLLRNTSLNHLKERVSCHRIALGAERGALNLCFRGGAGAAAVIQSHPKISLLAGPRLERAPVEALDEWVNDHELTRLDVLKVDIEGAEPLMFRGAIPTIERFLPVILAEFNHWWAEHHGLSIAHDCFEPLWDLGYQAFRVDSHRRAWKQVSGRPDPGPDMEDTLWIPPGRSLDA